MPTPTKGPRLGGGPAHEKLIIANLARALFSEGRIRTTEAKAKRLRPQAERLITFAKRGDVASRRQVLTVVRDKAVVHTLFAEIAPRFADRQGGYTRILKLGPRPGDGAPMVLIELVEQGEGERAASDTEEGGRRRRRFGRRGSPAEAAPEGANRAERRAALRRRGAAPVGAEAALAGEDLDDDTDELDEDRPAVPTDAEIEAGVTAAGDEDEDQVDEVESDEVEDQAEAGDDEAGDVSESQDDEAPTGEADTAVAPGVTESGVDESEPAAAQADDDAAETADEDEDQDRKEVVAAAPGPHPSAPGVKRSDAVAGRPDPSGVERPGEPRVERPDPSGAERPGWEGSRGNRGGGGEFPQPPGPWPPGSTELQPPGPAGPQPPRPAGPLPPGPPGPTGPQPSGPAGPLRRLRLVVAYDGASFSGFARQRDRRTVQGDLEAALEGVAKQPVGTVGAGRTDAGVHARGQVVHADVPARLDPERVRRALNGRLGPDITVREAGWAPPGFDARHSARRRTYIYRIDDSGDPDPLLRGFVLAWPRPLDLARMREAAGPLAGEHDFAAFCRSRAGATTTRRLRSLGIRRRRGLVEVRLVADAFCWQMVRGIVGHLLLVGDGRRDPASTVAVLAAGDRSRAGNIAPAHGLVLESVTYVRR